MNTSVALSYSVAIVLTWTAGFVDAVGFLNFARIYTANMSGNSVAFGIALGRRNWSEAFFRLWPILLYVAGLLLGRMVIEIGAYRQIRRIASIAFAFEAALLGVAILLATLPSPFSHSDWQTFEIGLLALAMGIQNATLLRFSSLTVHTGFVTGALVKFAEQFVGYATWLAKKIRDKTRLREIIALTPREKSLRSSAFLLLVWTAYVVGALFGAWRESVTKIDSLEIPVTAILILIALDLSRPLAQGEEKEQASLSK